MSESRHWSVPASAGRVNEDAVFRSPRVAVVVDGAGLPQSLRAGCCHSVDWYSKQLARRFGAALNDTALTMRQALSQAIIEVSKLHDGCTLVEGSPSATVAAWCLRPPMVEYIVLCDASAIAVLADRVVEITDAGLAALLAEQGHRIGSTEGSASEILKARAVILQSSRNVEGGYWCCQIDPGAADHALTGSYPVSDVLGLVLATDGATRGFQSLGIHTVEEFASRVLTGDTPAVLDEIRVAEHDQREQLLAIAIKVHDDATVVALDTSDLA